MDHIYDCGVSAYPVGSAYIHDASSHLPIIIVILYTLDLVAAS